MAAYLTLAQWRLKTQMPASAVDALEAEASGYIDEQLEDESRWIDARLAKRYAVPFVVPVPTAVTRWLARIVTESAYLRRGYNPDDQQAARFKELADEARAEIKEAADSEKGLFELPLREDTTAGGISKGAPMGYSEASPFVFMDRQVATGRDEDRNGTGTSDA